MNEKDTKSVKPVTAGQLFIVGLSLLMMGAVLLCVYRTTEGIAVLRERCKRLEEKADINAKHIKELMDCKDGFMKERVKNVKEDSDKDVSHLREVMDLKIAYATGVKYRVSSFGYR